MSLNIAFLDANQAISCHSHILSKSINPYTSPISTFLWHPTIYTPMLQMPKPSQSNIVFVVHVIVLNSPVFLSCIPFLFTVNILEFLNFNQMSFNTVTCVFIINSSVFNSLIFCLNNERLFFWYVQEINEEWLSDKSRFAYDGLKRQRLVAPMIKDSQNQLVSCSWEEAFFSTVGKVRFLFSCLEKKYL